MCKIIDTDAFLAYILKSRPQVYYRELRALNEEIQQKHPDFLIDISAPSIDLALHYYPKLFHKGISSSGAFIKRAEDSEKYFDTSYIEDEFIESSSDNNALKELDLKSA